MASIVANGLGGGSLINAGVLMRPDADVFAQPHWPAALRHASDTRGAGGVRAPLGLDAAFERAAGMLGGELFRDPGQPAGAVSALPKAQALVRVARALAEDKRLAEQTGPAATLDFEPRPARVTIALDACTRCGDCFSGCNVPGAKKTLATTYLGRAVEAGARLVTRCLVYTLAPEPGGRGWALRVMATEHGQHARTLADVDALHGTTLRARTVVVAAGTFGSTELLMRSTRRAGALPAVPAARPAVSGNGDGLSAIADLDPAPDGLGHGAQTLGAPAPVGPTITTVLDLRGHPSIAQRVVVQEGATPGAMVGLYRESWRAPGPCATSASRRATRAAGPAASRSAPPPRSRAMRRCCCRWGTTARPARSSGRPSATPPCRAGPAPRKRQRTAASSSCSMRPTAPAAGCTCTRRPGRYCRRGWPHCSTRRSPRRPCSRCTRSGAAPWRTASSRAWSITAAGSGAAATRSGPICW